jgi:mannose-6-phosphate isomerase-like protein (cupin superfamily)
MNPRLEGGFRVTGLRHGVPLTAGTVRAWPVVGRATGAERVSLRTLEFGLGESPALRCECADVWYVLEGGATLDLDGRSHDLLPGTGVYLAPGRGARVRNPSASPLVVASARCPEPEDADVLGVAATGRPDASSAAANAPAVVRLGDRPRATTGDRWYAELVNDAVGCLQVTQFVGSIPPGRAPDHNHHYEEVIVVLAGHGVAWAGETHIPIASGSCIYLPRKQVHCLENTGKEPLLLVGVFYPAGSPAVRYPTGSSATEDPSIA